MIPLVEFCINNLTDEVVAVKKKLEDDSGLDVLEYDCLRYCGICGERPYALVNGEVVKADTGENLLAKIYEAIEEAENHY